MYSTYSPDFNSNQSRFLSLAISQILITLEVKDKILLNETGYALCVSLAFPGGNWYKKKISKNAELQEKFTYQMAKAEAQHMKINALFIFKHFSFSSGNHLVDMFVCI